MKVMTGHTAIRRQPWIVTLLTDLNRGEVLDGGAVDRGIDRGGVVGGGFEVLRDGDLDVAIEAAHLQDVSAVIELGAAQDALIFLYP